MNCKFDADKLNLIKDEVNTWAQHNFPTTTAEQCLLGIFEEIGELSHAILKESQGIRKENFHSAKKDALADITVFLLDYMNRDKMYFNINYLDNYISQTTSNMLNNISSLSNSTRIIVDDRIIYPYFIPFRCSEFVNKIVEICEELNINFMENLEETWNEVKKRDWIKYPFNGLTE